MSGKIDPVRLGERVAQDQRLLGKLSKSAPPTPRPAEVFHVGEYIGDEMDERGMDCIDMERATGISYRRWAQLCACDVGLLGHEAEALERIGWGSSIMWMHLNLAWQKAPRRCSPATLPRGRGPVAARTSSSIDTISAAVTPERIADLRAHILTCDHTATLAWGAPG